ncbi:putative signal peptide protein [Puccinia sorghi]|uniref:Putative signal peptide protein n=1 Tax=Puccinia sorghi TaxID=27349 RepID=A0A0L6UXR4_9BASI|nr:putative signal peptide protein [Puccinia sorghi]
MTCRNSNKVFGVNLILLPDLFNQALMQSHCADCTLTVPKHPHMQTDVVWMAAWLEHATCQLKVVEQFFLQCDVMIL